ncbi:hypothetical protein [Salinarimonas soli]|uniref:hypothetical protein n=1 Tax=Salinarimonas soli TaxID=1638099 RepID=UPI0016619BD8|nr:hypothetical protein [Salinarimonas soli]
MFVVRFADGETAYLVLPRSEVPLSDTGPAAFQAVLQRQARGELRGGEIAGVTRAR